MSDFTNNLELDVETALEFAHIDDIGKKINPKYIRHYIYLDSDLTYEKNLTNDTFTWLLNSENRQLTHGTINVDNKLENIIAMRLTRTTFANMDDTFTYYINGSQEGTFPNRRGLIPLGKIAFTIDELKAQSMINPSGLKYHFIQQIKDQDTSIGSNSTITSYMNNRGWFYFDNVVKKLESITLSMYKIPTEVKLQIPIVKTSFIATVYFQKVKPSTGLVSNWITLVNVDLFPYCVDNVKPGTNLLAFATTCIEEVEISDFTTNDVVTDAALIAAFNSKHILTRTDDGYWDCPVDITGASLTAADYPNITITLLYKPKFSTTLEFISIEEE